MILKTEQSTESLKKPAIFKFDNVNASNPVTESA